MSQVLRVAMVLFLVFGFSGSAIAQDSGARVSGFYAGAFGEGATNAAAGGSVGYRFTPRLGFELGALALPDFEIDDIDGGREGRGVGFLANFVMEFPSPARWLTPYIQGGGGGANISYSSEFVYQDGDGRPIPIEPRGRRIGGVRFDPRTLGDNVRLVRVNQGRSETSVALSVGGGVDFTLWKGLAVGPNITFVELFGSSRNIALTNIGARASYRF